MHTHAGWGNPARARGLPRKGVPGWHALRLAIPALLTILALALAACAGPEAPGSGTPGQGAQGAAPGSGQGAAREGQETGPTGDQPPLTYLICFEPGGQSDIEARRQQPHLERILGRKVVIDYKVGGGGALCWSELARSRPDGSIVAGINLPHIILQPLQQETGYRTEQIEPVAFFQSTPLGLAVLKSSPYRTLADLLTAARVRPEAITYAQASSSQRVAAEMLASMADVKMLMVPYRASPLAVQDLIAGRVDLFVADQAVILPQVQSGALRALAVTTKERSAQLPNVPTIAEAANLPNYVQRPVRHFRSDGCGQKPVFRHFRDIGDAQRLQLA